MAGKKKTMGRGLGSLLERRASVAAKNNAALETSVRAEPDAAEPSKQSARLDPAASTPIKASTQDNTRANTEANTQTSTKAGPQASTPASTPASAETENTNPTGDKLRTLGIDQIVRGSYQPRRHFDPELLQELADSLKSEGLIQPILVRPEGTGQYELIAGERRWRAAQLAGFTEIPAIVRELEDRAVAAVSLIENIQRKDLNPLEEAEALRRLSDEFGLSHQEVADSVGRSRSAVTNLMRLLDLHDDAKALVDVGDIDMGHARALLGAPFDEQPAIARRIAAQGLTVRAVEKQIKALRAGETAKSESGTVSDPDIDRLEKHLTQKLGAKVSIRHKAAGSGKLEIQYHSMDELDGILNHIK